MLGLRAEQLVFIDESAFREQTGWRQFAYAPIGEDGRYSGDVTRGDTWSLLPAYTTEGYLPCTAIKEGFFNSQSLLQWVVDSLLPCCNPFPGTRSIIVMDNVAIHCRPEIQQAIEAAGCQYRYLPPYSPDFNPIELTFSLLKRWIRKHFHRTWKNGFEGNFGDFIRFAVRESRCDSFPRAHFKHCAGGYVYEIDVEEFEKVLDQLE